MAPAKSLIAAGTGQGRIVGRGVVQHQAVEDFALPGVGGDKWENGKKRLRCRESQGFVALGRWRLFALTVEKGEPKVCEKRRRRDHDCSVRIARGDDVSNVHVNAFLDPENNTVTRELTAVTCHVSPSTLLCFNFVALELQVFRQYPNPSSWHTALHFRFCFPTRLPRR